MTARIAIVDYEKGNLASVRRGLADAGFDAQVTGDPAQIAAADGIVLPGVGAFRDAMETMSALGQAQAVRERVAAGVPFLGICLGLHLIFEWGDEGCAQGERIDGLGLLPGHIERMPALDSNGVKHKIPHVGWNSVELTQAGSACPLFDGLADGRHFYFTHSYCAVPDDEADTAATTEHAQRFACAVWHGNVYGVQFHPEKSSADGLRVLENFGRIVEAAS